MQKKSLISILKEKVKGFFIAIIAFTVLVLLWHFAVKFTRLGLTVPSPYLVFDKLILSLYVPIGKYTIFGHAAWSLMRVFIGFSIASVAGIIVGLAMGWSKLAEAIIKPIFEALRPIPPLAWIPMAILWFGIGEGTKYFIIFIGAFVAVTINAYSGARRVDPILIGAARMLGAKENQLFTKIVLPSTVPPIFAGLQVGVSACWMSVLAAEMVRSSEGMGWIIIMGMQVGDTAQIMVGMISIGFIGLILATVMRGAESKLCAWNNRGR